MKRQSDSKETSTFRIQELPPAAGMPRRLALSGSLDVDGAPVLMEKLREVLKCGSKQVDLDFGGVTFVSSLGIGTLIAAIGEYREVQGDIVLGGLSDDILTIFQMLDLLDFVTLRS